MTRSREDERHALRALDDGFLPVAARWLRRVADRLRRGPAGVGAHVGHAVHDQPAVAGAIAVVLAASILIAAAGDDRVRDADRLPAAPDQPGTALTATVGPVPGTTVSAYFDQAAADVRRYARSSAGRSTYVLVAFDRYVTAPDAAQLLTGVPTVRVFVRVPSRLPTEVRTISLDRGSDRLGQGMITSAAIASSTAHSYHALVEGFRARSAADRRLRRRYALQERAARLEARRLVDPRRCRCVFGAVVHVDLVAMATLSRKDGIRSVDPALPGIALSALTFLPLRPDVHGVVPRPGDAVPAPPG